MPEIRPQPGPQEAFLASSADIVIYGGAAGGGKTWALLMEQLRHINNPDFGSVIFRRESTQITSEGGLWDTSEIMFLPLGAKGVTSPHHQWVFPLGSKVAFRHLQHDKHIHAYQGSQIPLICFDELTHFSEKQFWYMLSRNRSACGVRPYIRATTNPDAESWVARLIDWWIDPDGYPDKSKSGVVRWFVRIDSDIVWADTREELLHHKVEPKSLTFISSMLQDNKILMEKDPGYLANLQAMTKVDRERLLMGNWRIKAEAGLVFDRHKIEIIPYRPECVKTTRAWDLAGTAGGGDWTAGVKMGKGADGCFYVLDVVRGQYSPGAVKSIIKSTASQDDTSTRLRLPQDPAQAGKSQAYDLSIFLSAYGPTFEQPTGSKLIRATPFAAAVENGIVKVVEAPWNEAFLSELHSFAGSPKDTDDQVDAASDAFNDLNTRRKYEGVGPVSVQFHN